MTPRLRYWREQRVLTQAELADLAGVPQPTISRLESGQRAGRPSTIRRLAAALNVEPSALLGDRRPQPPAEDA